MTKQKKAEAPEKEPEEKAETKAEAPVYADGYRTFLYHESAPGGQQFVGQAANEALAAGWVDHPSKIKRK